MLKKRYIKAVDCMSFRIDQGETFGLVGGERMREDHRRKADPPTDSADVGKNRIRRD